MIKFLVLLFTFIQILALQPLHAAEQAPQIQEEASSPTANPVRRTATEVFSEESNLEEAEDDSYHSKRPRGMLQEISILTEEFQQEDRRSLDETLFDVSQLDENGIIYVEGTLYLANDTFIENIKYFINELNKLPPSISILFNSSGLSSRIDEEGNTEKLINFFSLLSKIRIKTIIYLETLFYYMEDNRHEISDLLKPFITQPSDLASEQTTTSNLQEVILDYFSSALATPPIQICNLFSVLTQIHSLKSLHIGRITFNSYSDDTLKELGKTITRMPRLERLYISSTNCNFSKMKVFLDYLALSSITTLGFKDEQNSEYSPYSLTRSGLIEDYLEKCTLIKTLETLDLRYVNLSRCMLKNIEALCNIFRPQPIKKVIFSKQLPTRNKLLATKILGGKAVFLD